MVEGAGMGAWPIEEQSDMAKDDLDLLVSVRVNSWIVLSTTKGNDPRNHTKQHETASPIRVR
jgi:hypothetical protein